MKSDDLLSALTVTEMRVRRGLAKEGAALAWRSPSETKPSEEAKALVCSSSSLEAA